MLLNLHQSTVASRWWCGPRPCFGWVKKAVGLLEGPGTPLIQTIFSSCCPLNDCRKATRNLCNRSTVSPFSCLSLSHLFILLFLMSGNVHPNLSLIFPCSVCSGNVTWRGRSVQCCTCSKWVHFKCFLIKYFSFSRFKTLGSSHFWSFPPCYVHASSEDPTPTQYYVFFFFGLL